MRYIVKFHIEVEVKSRDEADILEAACKTFYDSNLVPEITEAKRKDTFQKELKNLLDYVEPDEKKHFEEHLLSGGKPHEHIYSTIKFLKNQIMEE